MIYLYTGTPGSGKSLHTASDILAALRVKKPVICNFPINEKTKGLEYFHYVPNGQLTPSFLVRFAADFWRGKRPRERSLLLIVDEAQLLFNSREWTNSERMAWIEFLSQHRHYGYNVIFIAQSDRMLDRQIRGLVEYEVKHRKISAFGLKGQIIKLLSFGEIFVHVTYYYGMTERICSEFTRGRRKLFNLYDTFSTFERVGENAPESAQETTASADGLPALPARSKGSRGSLARTDRADKPARCCSGDFFAALRRFFRPHFGRHSKIYRLINWALRLCRSAKQA